MTAMLPLVLVASAMTDPDRGSSGGTLVLVAAAIVVIAGLCLYLLFRRGSIADRARTELVTAGARPRRQRTSGLDALTASERRVAELARDGMTNRQIAEALFVTAGTVEKHLASVYAKLEIAGRAQLPQAFAPH